MAQNAALIDLEPVERWQGSRELVPASSIVCSWCGPTFEVTYTQPALFRHGDYGATDGFRVRSCGCGAIRIVSRSTLNPRR